LASAGYAPTAEVRDSSATSTDDAGADARESAEAGTGDASQRQSEATSTSGFVLSPRPQQERIGFGFAAAPQRESFPDEAATIPANSSPQNSDGLSATAELRVAAKDFVAAESLQPESEARAFPDLPPLDSAYKFVSEVAVESVGSNIRPLGQLDESFIIATDDEGLLLIDQHVAHERVLFDKYRALESSRRAASQQMLIPETFDLTPAQAAAFDVASEELEAYGFELMRLSGRTVAIKSTPADLPASEARNVLAEVLDTVDAEKRGAARANLRDEIAASLACHAAIKVNMPLAPEKMRWLIDRLLTTSSPTTCPHGRPVILRLAMQDILKGFHRI
jgi:DNA mismatch repair protein MutL